jgi:hypothetical protein
VEENVVFYFKVLSPFITLRDGLKRRKRDEWAASCSYRFTPAETLGALYFYTDQDPELKHICINTPKS